MNTQEFLTSAWGWHPAVIGLCAVALAGYAWLRRVQFSGRSLFLLAAVAVFFLALASPLAVLADGYLFSAHMLQHLLLQLVVPPLVLLSLPVGQGEDPKAKTRRPKAGRSPKVEKATAAAGERAADSGFRGSGFFRPSDFGLRTSPPLWLKPVLFILRRPLVTWLLGLGAMWLWHIPSLCSASAMNPWVHALQGISLLLMGTAFWWPIIGPWREQWLPPLLGVVYLFSACVGCTILGIILTFAPLGVCPVFMHPLDGLGILPLLQDGWGLTPLKDQQLGGLLMWVPPCFVYLCGIFGLLARWYAGPDPEIAPDTESPPATAHPGFAEGVPLSTKP